MVLIPGYSSKPYDRDVKKSFWSRIRCGRFLGFMYTFLGSLFLNLTVVIVKKMVYISPGQLSLVRNIGLLVWSVPIVIFTGNNLLGPKKHKLDLLLCGFLGTTALYLNHVAFRVLPLAEAVILTSTTPAMTMIGARLFLKESCGLVASCALVLTILGVLLYMRVPELMQNRSGLIITTEYITGIAAAIGSVMFRSVFFLLTRKMKSVHFAVLSIYIGFLGVVENTVLTAAFSFFKLPRCGWDSLMMMCVAVCGFAGHCFMTLAIQSEVLGIVTVVRCSMDVVTGLVFQVVFFRYYPVAYNYIGALIVIVAVTTIGLRKWLQQQTKESMWKKKLKFLLI